MKHEAIDIKYFYTQEFLYDLVYTADQMIKIMFCFFWFVFFNTKSLMSE